MKELKSYSPTKRATAPYSPQLPRSASSVLLSLLLSTSSCGGAAVANEPNLARSADALFPETEHFVPPSDLVPKKDGWAPVAPPLIEVRVDHDSDGKVNAANLFNSTIGVEEGKLRSDQDAGPPCARDSLFQLSSGKYTAAADRRETVTVNNLTAKSAASQVYTSLKTQAGIPAAFWFTLKAELDKTTSNTSSSRDHITYEWWEISIDSINTGHWWKSAEFSGCRGKKVSSGAIGYAVTEYVASTEEETRAALLKAISASVAMTGLSSEAAAKLSSVANSVKYHQETHIKLNAPFRITHLRLKTID